MAMGNFLGGVFQGGLKTWEMFQQDDKLKMEREKADRDAYTFDKQKKVDASTAEIMDEKPVDASVTQKNVAAFNAENDKIAAEDQAFIDEVNNNQAGGANEPKLTGKDYVYGNEPVASAKFTYGGVTQDKPFTKDEILASQADRISDVMTSNGDIKGALDLRAGGLKVKAARRVERNAEQIDQINQAYATLLKQFEKKDFSGLTALGDVYNSANGKGGPFDDGGTVSFGTSKDGGTVISQIKDGKVVQQMPVNYETAQKLAERYRNAAIGAIDYEVGLKIQKGEREDAKLAQDEKKLANQLTVQEMKDTARAMSDDKRFAALLNAANAKSARGESGGKQPTHVATAEWLKEKGIAKTDAEAWQMANQLGEAVNEKVTTDSFGNTTIHSPKTGEISRIDSDGNKSVIRPAAKGAAPVITPHQEYLEAFTRAKGNPELQKKITDRARQNGVVK